MVPFGRGADLGFQFVGARRHIELHDQPVVLEERIAGDRRLDPVVRQRVEAQADGTGYGEPVGSACGCNDVQPLPAAGRPSQA